MIGVKGRLVVSCWTWAKYITELRDKKRTLRALKEELANAGL